MDRYDIYRNGKLLHCLVLKDTILKTAKCELWIEALEWGHEHGYVFKKAVKEPVIKYSNFYEV